jgi:hypothetical protein
MAEVRVQGRGGIERRELEQLDRVLDESVEPVREILS